MREARAGEAMGVGGVQGGEAGEDSGVGANVPPVTRLISRPGGGGGAQSPSQRSGSGPVSLRASSAAAPLLLPPLSCNC